MVKDCVKYFKDNKAYKRIFMELRKKWKIYGSATGVITLKNATEDEKEALRAIMGKIYYESDIKFKVSEFEQALTETNFKLLSLQDLLEAYFLESMETNQNIKEKKAEKKAKFFEELYLEVGNQIGCPKAANWIYSINTDKKYGYNLIIAEYEKSEKDIKTVLLNVCKGIMFLERLENQKIRLAVLSAEITNNPHYFDKENVAGKLLIAALRFIHHTIDSNNAEETLELYYLSGIKPDDISSFTTLYGISLYTEAGIHKAYEYFMEQKESYVVTLSNLSSITRVDSRNKKVFIFENQMVFSHMCESLRELPVSLLCTSGQMKTASLLLIDFLCVSGCTLYYSGDIDPEGLGIADRIITRHPENIVPWRMAVEDYRKCISEEILSEKRLKQLERIGDVRLIEVAKVLSYEKCAGYQELLLDEMIGDIRYLVS